MSIIIRLQKLPWSATAMDIRRFFFGLQIPDGGVHIVGGDDGDAFIAFSSDEDARKAMRLDGGQILNECVKLYLSSKNEMQTVIKIARNSSELDSRSKASYPPAPYPSLHNPPPDNKGGHGWAAGPDEQSNQPSYSSNIAVSSRRSLGSNDIPSDTRFRSQNSMPLLPQPNQYKPEHGVHGNQNINMNFPPPPFSKANDNMPPNFAPNFNRPPPPRGQNNTPQTSSSQNFPNSQQWMPGMNIRSPMGDTRFPPPTTSVAPSPGLLGTAPDKAPLGQPSRSTVFRDERGGDLNRNQHPWETDRSLERTPEGRPPGMNMNEDRAGPGARRERGTRWQPSDDNQGERMSARDSFERDRGMGFLRKDQGGNDRVQQDPDMRSRDAGGPLLRGPPGAQPGLLGRAPEPVKVQGILKGGPLGMRGPAEDQPKSFGGPDARGPQGRSGLLDASEPRDFRGPDARGPPGMRGPPPGIDQPGNFRGPNAGPPDLRSMPDLGRDSPGDFRGPRDARGAPEMRGRPEPGRDQFRNSRGPSDVGNNDSRDLRGPPDARGPPGRFDGGRDRAGDFRGPSESDARGPEVGRDLLRDFRGPPDGRGPPGMRGPEAERDRLGVRGPEARGPLGMRGPPELGRDQLRGPDARGQTGIRGPEAGGPLGMRGPPELGSDQLRGPDARGQTGMRGPPDARGQSGMRGPPEAGRDQPRDQRGRPNEDRFGDRDPGRREPLGMGGRPGDGRGQMGDFRGPPDARGPPGIRGPLEGRNQPGDFGGPPDVGGPPGMRNLPDARNAMGILKNPGEPQRMMTGPDGRMQPGMMNRDGQMQPGNRGNPNVSSGLLRTPPGRDERGDSGRFPSDIRNVELGENMQREMANQDRFSGPPPLMNQQFDNRSGMPQSGPHGLLPTPEKKSLLPPPMDQARRFDGGRPDQQTPEDNRRFVEQMEGNRRGMFENPPPNVPPKPMESLLGDFPIGQRRPEGMHGNLNQTVDIDLNGQLYVFVVNLPPTISYKEVRRFFTGCNIVNSGIKMINDDAGNRKGEAYVMFSSENDTRRAIECNGTILMGKRIAVLPVSRERYDIAIDSFHPNMSKALLGAEEELAKAAMLIQSQQLGGEPFNQNQPQQLLAQSLVERLKTDERRVVMNSPGRSPVHGSEHSGRHDSMERRDDRDRDRRRPISRDRRLSSEERRRTFDRRDRSDRSRDRNRSPVRKSPPRRGRSRSPNRKPRGSSPYLVVSRLPRSVTRQNIRDLLRGLKIARKGDAVHLEVNQRGTCTGCALVQMDNERDFGEALRIRNGKINSTPVKIIDMGKKEYDERIEKSREYDKKHREKQKSDKKSDDGKNGSKEDSSKPKEKGDSGSEKSESQSNSSKRKLSESAEVPSKKIGKEKDNAGGDGTEILSWAQEVNREEKAAAMADIDPDLTCVMVDGLPGNCTETKLKDFFKSTNVQPLGIHLIKTSGTTVHPKAFVEFKSAEDCKKAQGKNKSLMDLSVISVACIKKGDMLKRKAEALDECIKRMEAETKEQPKPAGNPSAGKPLLPHPAIDAKAQGDKKAPALLQAPKQPPKPLLPSPQTQPLLQTPRPPLMPPQQCAIKVSNLPFRATIQEIANIFKDFEPDVAGILLRYDPAGRPTGDAMVPFFNPPSARDAFMTLDKTVQLGRRIWLNMM